MKTSSSKMPILCHGKGGNADLLIEAYLTIQNEIYLKQAQQIEQQIEQNYQATKTYPCESSQAKNLENSSLFMGIAGIGYFYLRLSAPHKIPSILLPRFNTTFDNQESLPTYPYLNIGLTKVKKIILSKIYPKTLQAFEDNVDKINSRFFVEESDSIGAAQKQFEKQIQKFPSIASSTTYKIEKEQWQLEQAIESYALLSVKSLFHEEDIRTIISLPDIDFLAQVFVRSPNIILKKYTDKNRNNNEVIYQLFKQTFRGVTTVEINDLIYHFLNKFAQVRILRTSIEQFWQEIENMEIEKEDFYQVIIQQTKELLRFEALVLPLKKL